MIVGAVIGLYFAILNGHLNEGTITGALTSFLGGIGLLFAKDSNVTGGTVVNQPNDASAVKSATKSDQ